MYEEITGGLKLQIILDAKLKWFTVIDQICSMLKSICAKYAVIQKVEQFDHTYRYGKTRTSMQSFRIKIAKYAIRLNPCGGPHFIWN